MAKHWYQQILCFGKHICVGIQDRIYNSGSWHMQVTMLIFHLFISSAWLANLTMKAKIKFKLINLWIFIYFLFIWLYCNLTKDFSYAYLHKIHS